MKTCLVRQPAGLGDILFCMKIAYALSERFDSVIWPLIPHYSWLPNYISYPKNVNMNLTTDDKFEMKQTFQSNEFKEIWLGADFYYLPLELASKNFPNCLIMNSKYNLAGVDGSDWRDYLEIHRHLNREQAIMDKMPPKYNLICDTFATPPHTITLKIDPKNEFPNVRMWMEGSTPFDWMGAIENAESLHFADTVYSYIVEKCNLKTDKLFLYPRKPEQQKSLLKTKHMFQTNWEYMNWTGVRNGRT